MNNYKLTIQYDGTRYSGWQKQGNTADTIQGKIETVLQKWLKEDIEIHGPAARMPASMPYVRWPISKHLLLYCVHRS